MGKLLFLSLCLILALRAPAAAQAGSRGSAGIPYGIDQRPQPEGSDLAVLLPVQVGPFTRAPLPADAQLRSDEDLTVHYTAGGDSVFVGFSLPESVTDAHGAVTTTRDEAVASKLDLTGAQYRVGKDPSYFRTAKFMAWTRDRYFYYADANRPSALERFMQAFPY